MGLKDLDWQKRFPTYQELVSAHTNKQYPPRFTLEFSGKDAEKSVTITICLTNVTQPVSYDIILLMPSESRLKHNITHPSSVSVHVQVNKKKVQKKPRYTHYFQF